YLSPLLVFVANANHLNARYRPMSAFSLARHTGQGRTDPEIPELHQRAVVLEAEEACHLTKLDQRKLRRIEVDDDDAIVSHADLLSARIDLERVPSAWRPRNALRRAGDIVNRAAVLVVFEILMLRRIVVQHLNFEAGGRGLIVVAMMVPIRRD